MQLLNHKTCHRLKQQHKKKKNSYQQDFSHPLLLDDLAASNFLFLSS